MKPLARELLKRRRQPLRPRPLLHLIPNLCTILGLCAGLTGMRYALDGRWELALTLLAAAVVLDGLDGRSARLLRISTPLGAQLDSLADFISFGVAPAVIVYLWTLHSVRGLGWALAMMFAVCCALRLARFNVEANNPDRPAWSYHFFAGIPAPAAAGLALLPMIAWLATGAGWLRGWLVNALMLAFVAAMMVSRVPTFSIKRLRIPPDYVVLVLVLAALLLVFLVTEPWATLTFIGIAYLLSIPAAVITARRWRLAEEEALASASAHEALVEPVSPPAEAKAAAETNVRQDSAPLPHPRVVPLDPRAPRR